MIIRVSDLRKAVEYLERRKLEIINVHESHHMMPGAYLSLHMGDEQVFVYANEKDTPHDQQTWRGVRVLRQEEL